MKLATRLGWAVTGCDHTVVNYTIEINAVCEKIVAVIWYCIVTREVAYLLYLESLLRKEQ